MSERPVWLETWLKRPGLARVQDNTDIAIDVEGDGATALMACGEHGKQEDRAALAAAAPLLVRALLGVEWIRVERSVCVRCASAARRCPSCDNCPSCALALTGHELHAPGCHIDGALTQAGFPDDASRGAARALLRQETKG